MVQRQGGNGRLSTDRTGSYANRGQAPPMYFYRDQRGTEVDLIIERPQRWSAVEIKSAATPSAHFFNALETFTTLVSSSSVREPHVESVVVYGGIETQRRTAGTLLSWKDIDEYRWKNG